jgi:hypothetical protein
MKTFTTMSRAIRFLQKNSILSEDIAAKVVVDTALTDTIKRQTHL